MTVHFWVCGDCDVADDYDPIIILRNPLAQEIIQQLNDKPTPITQLAQALSEDEDPVIHLLVRSSRKSGISSFPRLTGFWLRPASWRHLPSIVQSARFVVWTSCPESL